MSHEKKISVVVLGSEVGLKNDLITTILGKVPVKANVLNGTEIYENERIKVTCTPHLYDEREDIRQLFLIDTHPDMFLLVVKVGFSREEVCNQVEVLHNITGKPTEEFIVVLPVEHTEPLRPNWLTTEQVISKLGGLVDRLAGGRHLMPNNFGNPDHPGPDMATSYPPMDVAGYAAPTRVNLVLLGMAGTGKSASGNTILGSPTFESRASSSPVTRECRAADAKICGRRVRVIDTPDIFDDEIDSSVKEQHVRVCRELCEQCPYVFLLVMHVSRFTDGERGIVNKLETTFRPDAARQTIILFTRGDDLKQGRMTIKQFLRFCQPDLKKIVEKCGNRCVFFENKAPRSHHVERLMQTVEDMLK